MFYFSQALFRDKEVYSPYLIMNPIFTIGHSNVSVADLLHRLLQYSINCVVDVRSNPVSSYSPHFNKEHLKPVLKQNNISYAHFGEEFGARRTDCLIDNQVNFELAVTTEKFQHGVSRIKNAITLGFNVVLMCSESEPLECHRFSLVSRFLHEQGMDVLHILKDGSIKSHEALEFEMIETYLKSRTNKLRAVETDLFGNTYTKEQQRIDAYRIKNREIGYRINENKPENQF